MSCLPTDIHYTLQSISIQSSSHDGGWGAGDKVDNSLRRTRDSLFQFQCTASQSWEELPHSSSTTAQKVPLPRGMHLPLRRLLIFPPVERRSINSCQKDPLAGNGRRDYFRRGRHMCRQFWDFLLRCHFRVELLVCDCYVIVWTGRNTCKCHRERLHSRSSRALLPCVSLPPLEGSVRSQLRSG